MSAIKNNMIPPSIQQNQQSVSTQSPVKSKAANVAKPVAPKPMAFEDSVGTQAAPKLNNAANPSMTLRSSKSGGATQARASAAALAARHFDNPKAGKLAAKVLAQYENAPASRQEQAVADLNKGLDALVMVGKGVVAGLEGLGALGSGLSKLGSILKAFDSSPHQAAAGKALDNSMDAFAKPVSAE
ncbi:hypothetical protein KAI87_00780 [Myxococcota bacterium]|nr:hypothetical protein [Myxococcota bacterium]